MRSRAAPARAAPARATMAESAIEKNIRKRQRYQTQKPQKAKQPQQKRMRMRRAAAPPPPPMMTKEMLITKEKIDYFIKHLVKVNNHKMDSLIAEGEEIKDDDLYKLFFCEERYQYYEDGTRFEEEDESSEDIPLYLIAEMNKSGIVYETKPKKRIIATYDSIYYSKREIQMDCNIIILPRDLTPDLKFALYMYFHKKKDALRNRSYYTNTFDTYFIESINATFVYKMLEQLMKYGKPDFLDYYVNNIDFQNYVYKHWNQMASHVHKGRIYGQFAIKESMKQALPEGQYYPKDVINLIGQYTKMEGGRK